MMKNFRQFQSELCLEQDEAASETDVAVGSEMPPGVEDDIKRAQSAIESPLYKAREGLVDMLNDFLVDVDQYETTKQIQDGAGRTLKQLKPIMRDMKATMDPKDRNKFAGIMRKITARLKTLSDGGVDVAQEVESTKSVFDEAIPRLRSEIPV